MDNVTPLPGITMHTPAGEAVPSLISLLESMLARAKAGEIVAIMGGGLNETGKPFDFLAGDVRDAPHLLATLEVQALRIKLGLLNARKTEST